MNLHLDWIRPLVVKYWLPVRFFCFPVCFLLDIFIVVQRFAQEKNIIVIATIHQPNFETLSLFSSLLLLGEGNVMYNGPLSEIGEFVSGGFNITMDR